MEKFSQRMGIKQVNTAIQIDTMDESLRRALWNDFINHVRWGMNSFDFNNLCKKIWMYSFNKLIDEAPSMAIDQTVIKAHYFTLQWYEVYDFLEFVANDLVADRPSYETTSIKFVEACNTTLKRELSAYRFVGKRLIQITSDQEISEIEEALGVSVQFTQHLKKALEILSDRKSPDYPNSIKESISAVEAICQLITESQKATLGDALRQLDSKLGGLHPALRNAFNNLYGYTSDAQGIRHGLVGESNLDAEDAKFMLTACSAFINYLVVKADKAGIKLPNK